MTDISVCPGTGALGTYVNLFPGTTVFESYHSPTSPIVIYLSAGKNSVAFELLPGIKPDLESAIGALRITEDIETQLRARWAEITAGYPDV